MAVDPNPIGVPPLNVQPGGVLDFYGIKNGAWGPRTFGSQLQPTHDLWRHYAATYGQPFDMQLSLNGAITLTFIGVAFTVFNAFGILSSAVPPSELWYIDQSVLWAQMSAGAGSRLTALGVDAGNPTNGYLQPIPFAPLGADYASDALSGINVLVSQLYPVFLQPSSSIQALAGGNIAATEVLILRWSGRVVRMRI